MNQINIAKILMISICFGVVRSECLETEFSCLGNKECIDLNWVCDAEADCDDKSDEWFCGEYLGS